MKRPVLSTALFLGWLALRQSATLADLLVASVLAWAIPCTLDRWLGPALVLRRPRVIVVLIGRVLWDIVWSNVRVAALVLNPLARPQPLWVRVPLLLDHPTAVAVFASIITLTPGTVSCVVDEEAGELWVHALDARDPEAVARELSERYELALLEIFE